MAKAKEGQAHAAAIINNGNETDMLNVALFGIAARQWREANPKSEGNIRDTASIEHLQTLSESPIKWIKR